MKSVRFQTPLRPENPLSPSYLETERSVAAAQGGNAPAQEAEDQDQGISHRIVRIS